MRIKVFLYLILISFIFVQKIYNHTIDICLDSQDKYEIIDDYINESFVLECLSFESDIDFKSDEFFYLVNLNQNQLVTINDLKNAIFYLRQKNKFKKICLSLTDGEFGKKLHFKLYGCWILEKVEISGLLFKDSYRQYYILEPGESFDENKHLHSIEKIKDVLSKKGYINTQIRDCLSYNEKNKTIDVCLNVIKGNRFSIEEVDFNLNFGSQVTTDSEVIKKRLYKKFARKLDVKYSWSFINKQAREIKNFLSENGYPSAVIKLEEFIRKKRNRIKLVFKIYLEKKRCCTIQGNKFFSYKELYQKVFSGGQISWSLSPSLLAQEIKQLYSNKGFWNASVTAQEEQGNYIFSIKEGPRAIIDTVIFKGVKNFSNKSLLKNFNSFLNRTYIDSELLNQCLDDLTNFYLKNGFWDFKILKKDFVLTSAPCKYLLEVTVDEGERKILSDICVENYPDLENQEIFLRFKNKKNIPFDITILNEQKKWLINYFQKLGHQTISVYPEFVQQDDGIKLIWKMELNKDEITFGKTIILGNSKAPLKNILREFNYNTGDSWDKGKLEQAFFKLNDAGVFNSVHIYPSRLFDFDGNKPVNVKLFQDKAFEIRTRMGFQQVSKNLTFRSGSTYKLGLSLIYNNPYELGDQFKFDIDSTLFYRELVAQFKKAWLFDRPINLIMKSYSNRYDQPLFWGSKQTLYKFEQDGALFGLNKKSRNLSSGINIGLEAVKITDISKRLACAIDFSPSLVNKRTPYFFLEPNILIDYLNDKLNPSHGFLIVASLKGMFSVKNDDYFLRFFAEHSFFFPFLTHAVGAVRFRFGHVFNEKFCCLIPPERFYLGGPNSIRSYEPDLAPPLSCVIDCGKKIFVPQGGRTMFNANFELRLPFTKNIGFVLFEDVGVLIKDSQQKHKSNLLTATGFGLRYHTPIGPLRFDIGWRPKMFECDSSFAWFLTLGQAF